MSHPLLRVNREKKGEYVRQEKGRSKERRPPPGYRAARRGLFPLLPSPPVAPKEPRPVGTSQPLPRGRRAPFLGLFLHQFAKVVFLLLHSPPSPPARWILLRHMLVAVKREVSQLDSSLSGWHVVQQQFIFLRDGERGTCEPPIRGGSAASSPPRLAGGKSPPRNAGGFGAPCPPPPPPVEARCPSAPGANFKKPRTPSSHARKVSVVES